MPTTSSLFKAEAEKNENARKAIVEARKLQRGWQAAARMLSRNPSIKVELTAGVTSCTDGKTVIYIKVPYELAFMPPHDRSQCGNRGEHDVLVCPACDILEDINITVIHEVAHAVFETFDDMTEYEKSRIIEHVVNLHAEGKPPESRIRQIKKNMEAAEKEGVRDYLSLSQFVSPYLPTIINACEDIRVNGRMQEERPGTRVMFNAQTAKVFREGIKGYDGVARKWNEMPPNAQAIIGLYCKAGGFEYKHALDPEIIDKIDDLELDHLCEQVAHAPSIRTIYQLSLPLLERLRQLGFCIDPDDPQETPSEEPDDQSGQQEEQNESGNKDGESGNNDSNNQAGESSDQSDDMQEDQSDSSSDVPSPDDNDGEDQIDEQDSGQTSEEGESDESSGSDSGEEDSGSTSDSDTDDSDASSGNEGDDPDADEADGSEDSSDDAQGEGDGTGTEEQSSGDGTSDEGDLGEDESNPSESQSDSDNEESDGSGSDRPGEEPGEAESDERFSESESSGQQSTEEEVESPESPAVDGEDTGSADADSQPDQPDGLSPGPDPDPLGEHATDQENGVETVDKDSPEPYTSDDQERDGTPEDVEEIFTIFGRHDEQKASPSESIEESAIEEAVERALDQIDFFDSPSLNIGTVQEYSYKDRQGAWRHDKEGSIVEVPESILTQSIMRMRLLFTDNARGHHERNRRSGRVDARSIGRRVPVQDDRIFKKKIEPGKKDYFVLIGLDCSGSTNAPIGYGKSRLDMMKAAAGAKAEMLSRLGIDFAMYAHSGDFEALAIFEIKGAKDPWGKDQREALEKLRPYSANLDGHSMEYYRKVVERRQETDRFLLYYTDGAMPAANYQEELEILQREIKTCERLGIHLVGVGVNTDSPTEHGLDTIRLDEVGDIPNVVTELRKRLTK